MQSIILLHQLTLFLYISGPHSLVSTDLVPVHQWTSCILLQQLTSFPCFCASTDLIPMHSSSPVQANVRTSYVQWLCSYTYNLYMPLVGDAITRQAKAPLSILFLSAAVAGQPVVERAW